MGIKTDEEVEVGVKEVGVKDGEMGEERGKKCLGESG
jgi:hypothetical protein